ncbi:hypothetical protein N9L08_09050 [Rhodobacteraceae bacterium]|nr:hypothetical protein [Paracoccaceae bacterium]
MDPNENKDAFNEEKADLSNDYSSEGIVYVLKRKSTTPVAMCKIGFSRISGNSRAKNYTDGDWSVVAEFHMPVWLAKLTEKAAHQELNEYWMDPGITGGTAHEVFYCDPETAEIVIAIAKEDCIKTAILDLNLSKQELIKIVYGEPDKKTVLIEAKTSQAPNKTLQDDPFERQRAKEAQKRMRDFHLNEEWLKQRKLMRNKQSDND